MDTISKINYIFSKTEKYKFCGLLILIFFSVLLELLSVSLILPLLEVTMDTNAVQTNKIARMISNAFNTKSGTTILILLAIFIALIFIGKNIFLGIVTYNQYRMIYNMQLNMSKKLLHCYLSKSYEYHLNKNSSEIMRCISKDIDHLFLLVSYCLKLTSELLVAILLIGFLFFSDITITLIVMLALGLCMLLFYGLFQKKIKTYGLRVQELSAKMIQWVNQSLGSIKEIKIFKNEDFFVNRFSENCKDYTIYHRKSLILQDIPRLLIESVCISSIVFTLIFKLINQQSITTIIPKLSVFAVVAFRLLPSTNRINANLTGILNYKASVDIIYNDILDSQRDANLQLSASRIPRLIDGFPLISLKNICFKYQNSTQNVLENINLSINRGESVAFIGPSGAGKTTLVDIILGLLNPQKGEVLFKGVSIDIAADIWAQSVGYIPQNIYLCDDTIRSNIAFAIPIQDIDDTKIWKALKTSRLDQFVKELPDGLNTLVGEQGVRLSGGQKQRLGIARALYNDPEILFLDEATSSLDNQTEKEIMDTINGLMHKKTIIIIAHRLSTIEKCNSVYEIDDRKIRHLR